MPIYSFLCQKCQNNFDLRLSFEEYDKKDPKKFRCPRCGSRKIKQNFTDIFFVKKEGGKSKFRCSCGG